jgi:hypothetical protein
MVSFSANEEGSLGTSLPYGLTMEDLSTRDFERAGEKILHWYEAKNAPLIELLGIEIILYRQDPVNKTLIKQANNKTTIFDSKGFTDLQVTMTLQDLSIPSITLSKEFQLPLDSLRDGFHSIIQEHSEFIAEERAEHYSTLLFPQFHRYNHLRHAIRQGIGQKKISQIRGTETRQE